MEGLLITLGLMIIAASIIALIAKWLRQPLILGYVAAGFLVGPALTGIINDSEPIALLSELGLIFLMFVIGLELDITKIKSLGKVSAALGTLQVIGTAALAAVLAVVFDFTWIQAIYLGLVIAFSSTIVVVKLLADKNELNTLHGELTLGILIVQDVFAVLALSLIGVLRPEGAASVITFPSLETVLGYVGVMLPHGAGAMVASILVQGFLFALFTYLFFRFVMPVAFRDTESSPELLFVSSLAVVFIISALAGFFQFSFAIGAFAAGIALSSAPYSHDLMGRVKPLKDFFLILFFVSMGLQVSFQGIADQFLLIAFLVAGALILKPLITFFAIKLLKYNNRTAFITSLHLAQVGEFGLILVSGGVLSGVLPASVLTATVLATIFTMTLAAYLIKYDEAFYKLFRPLIAPSDLVFGTRPEEVRNVPEKFVPEIVVFGVTPVTVDLIEESIGKRKLLIIEENPINAIKYKERGIPTICSDPMNTDLYESVDLSKADIIVSGVRDPSEILHGPSTTLFIVRKVREVNKHAALIIGALSEQSARRLYEQGATIVLTPNFIGKRFLSTLLADKNRFKLKSLGAAYRKELDLSTTASGAGPG